MSSEVQVHTIFVQQVLDAVCMNIRETNPNLHRIGIITSILVGGEFIMAFARQNFTFRIYFKF